MKSNSISPDAEYQRIAEANRQFYASAAGLYDATECCVNSPQVQSTLTRELEEIVALLKQRSPQVTAIDACGGSGNISLKLLRMGVDVTLADISTELSKLFVEKCRHEGLQPKVVNGEIASILSAGEPKVDLIVFSSALHHLQNIPMVLQLACDRLAPGGMLFTSFDPTSRAAHNLFTKAMLRAEYYLFKAVEQTSDLPGAVKRRLSRVFQKNALNKQGVPLTEENLGFLAEYHVHTGIDDLALLEKCKAMGFQVRKHIRYVDTRYALTGWIIRTFTRNVTSFKLLLEKPQ